ncbi:GNAT family N-acetyltransferase [uncultured virus]|nr:GNAT family N-acetyltransferase [uncultured virus]
MEKKAFSVRSVRKAVVDDADAISAIAKLCFVGEEIYPLFYIRDFCSNGLSFVCFIDGVMAGYVIHSNFPSEFEDKREVPTVMSLGVHPDFRRRGVAELLLLNVKAFYKAPIYLHVRVKNTAAQAVYTKQQFVAVFKIEGYYTKFTSVPDDAYYMMYIPDRQAVPELAPTPLTGVEKKR